MNNECDKTSRDNAIDISGTITDSTISVNQNQDGNQSINEKAIEYEVNENSSTEINGESYKKPTMVFYISLGVLTLSILANAAGLFSYLGLNFGIAILILLPICFLIAVITKNDRWLSNLPNDGKAQYHNGWWYEKLDNDNVAKYQRRAKCIYPKCYGFINIVPAPPRESSNHSFVGKCSVGGLQHTYTVDFNGIGYAHKFDWRDLPQETK